MTILWKTMQKTKHKPQSSIRKKFFKVLLILIAIPVLTRLFCYGFAHFGGEFATANVLPVHPESVYIGAVYSDGIDDYRIKQSIYNSTVPVDDLRTWFIENDVPLSPIPYTDYLGNSKVLKSDGYYGTVWGFDEDNVLQELHISAAFLEGWFAEMIRSCQSVRVYYDLEVFKQNFPDIQADNLITPYVVRTCWPQIK